MVKAPKTQAASVFLLLLLTVGRLAYAQQPGADLKPTLNLPETADPGETLIASVIIGNAGPSAAKNVRVRWEGSGIRPLANRCRPSGEVVDCQLTSDLPSGSSGTALEALVYVDVATAGAPSIKVTVTSDTPDPDPSNNSIARQMRLLRGVRLRVSLLAPTAAAVGLAGLWEALVDNAGPATARDVVLVITLPQNADVETVDDDRCVRRGQTLRCVIGDVSYPSPFSSSGFVGLRVTPKSAEGPLVLTAAASTSAEELDGAGDTATKTVPVAAGPILTLSADAPDRAGDSNTARVRYTISNDSALDASQVTFRFVARSASAVASDGWSCVPTLSDQIDCTLNGLLGARQKKQLTVETTQTKRATRSPGSALLRWFVDGFGTREERVIVPPFYRHFTVTSTADRSPGSLRQAMLDANARCTDPDEPCMIDFAIDAAPGAGGWYIIRPESPLPVVTAPDVTVDGGSQTRFGGDGNLLGPEIELNGSRLPSGNGIEFRTDTNRYLEVSGLAVDGFPDFAVVASSNRDAAFTLTVTDNYIGLDPSGKTAVPNGRGIGVSGTYGGAQIRSNIISGNRWSGIFLLSGSATISGNRIGVAAASDAPIQNGASGIFLGPGMFVVQIAHNVINANREFGVAIYPSRNALNYVDIGSNSIFGNGRTGIDIDLDGAHPVVELLSAHYDAATDTTIVTGGGPPSTRDSFHIFYDSVHIYRLYSSETPGPGGIGDGQRYLGAVSIRVGKSFRFTFPGDLRGKLITATATTILLDDLQAPSTSEFSAPIEVKD